MTVVQLVKTRDRGRTAMMVRLTFAVLFVITCAGAEDVVSTPKPKKVLDTVMNPAYIPLEEKHGSFWKKSASEALKSKLKETVNTNKAKNGILFIGDGMSIATIMAARTLAGQVERGLGEDNVLAFEKFPIAGLARTYCIDAQVADSACTATSYLSGVKTKYGVIGLDGNATRGSCLSQLHKANWSPSIGQWALENGLDVGLVTTTRVTHASPAGMYAHTSERNWESDADVPEECLSLGCQDIAYQLVTGNPGRHFKVIMGGGRREFLPNVTSPLTNSTGRRRDGVDLTELWHQDKLERNATHQYVTERNELMKVFESDDLPEYLLGLFQDDHMDYHLQAKDQPTLEEMVEVAIKVLSRSSKGYFLFVEGGRIDHAHHDSYAYLALDETIEYSKAVQKAKSLTNETDTLIVVSSDHAHTMTVAGYPSRGNDILGLVDAAHGSDGKPYTTISYANGKATSITDKGRVDLSLESDFKNRKLDYSYPSLVPLDSETHGGEDVAVFASGPWQHLFTSSYEQSAIPHFMSFAMCLNDIKHEQCKRHRTLWTSSSTMNKPIKYYILSLLAVIFISISYF
ncbi:alkaline phosphatase [Danaus plexippus plexippus]|uniref:Alkaline phosphatase n=1 Tax=Danaus plexippus plexippus TaxID=278856 RepID=A0A212FHB6_DANPL|nr:membrane-bound alkaline phosphatase-like isoform X1 [Danaus plexippus plexippus]OWR53113.1 alkaline phosphatase [Danaus plexippus plexippus]